MTDVASASIDDHGGRLTVTPGFLRRCFVGARWSGSVCVLPYFKVSNNGIQRYLQRIRVIQ